MLTTVHYGGKAQDAIVSANKDGLWYVLNADTGKPIIPVKEMQVQQSTDSHTWATQPIPATEALIPENVPDRAKWKNLVAPDGKPYNIGPGGPAGEFVAVDSKSYSVTAAGPGQGASGNKPASLDPTTGLMLEETTPGFYTFKQPAVTEVPKLNYYNFGVSIDYGLGSLNGTPAGGTSTELEALNPSTGKIVWKVDRPNPTKAAALAKATPFLGGVLIADGLVFANGGSHLQAFDEQTGKLLWTSPKLVGASDSPPTVYAVNGKEYVTTMLGSTGDLYAFALA
jgi:glucose dehydrogenase